MSKFKVQSLKSEVRKPVFAKKSFGQNFLVDENYIDKIISALNIQENETIIEIGAGRGALTERLIESGANVIAIELERGMTAVLRERFGDRENFQLVESDALKVDFSSFIVHSSSLKLKLVANLPYNISTAILQKLIEQREVFSEMVLMFQREVVERITARAGGKERGFLSVLVQAYLETEKLFDVSPNAFRPSPKVWSAVVKLQPKTNVEIADEHLFRQVISAGFAQKRKTILNNLKNAPPDFREKIGDAQRFLEVCGIAPARRAETLTIEEWQCLCNFSCGKSEKLIYGVKVIGSEVDSQTRCAHYHSEIDVIAIKFKCCEQWFPCFECHAEYAAHPPSVWAKNEFDTPAVLCGCCGHQLTVKEYLECESACPQCGSKFNTGCARHYYLYFE